MTYAELRRTLRATLSEAGRLTGLPIDTVYEADEILRLVAGLDRAAVLLRGAEEADETHAVRCIAAAKGRGEGIPLAYLLGISPFCGEDFYCAPGCLIPRADTEVLVEEATSRLPAGGILWDLCTGSACVPISVLLQRQDVPAAFGVELYPSAAAAAERNMTKFADAIGNRFTLVRGDVLLGDIPQNTPAPAVITANPPYISSAVIDTLDVQVQMEPRTALDGGEDGLRFYRAILAGYLGYLAEGGCIIFEIGYDQKRAIRALAQEYDCTCIIRRDYDGNDRVAVIKPHPKA
ncbi:MAG: peptide chain release factor N(5)-glutamine methyltransferase [Ruminococcaceae bacterium]|nr:peptide chain release factor N(5)-glutamine methyltransferase [Oscillospiraceae bacterium]